jgi:hypothetical protein
MMPQLHFYVPEAVATRLQSRAKAAGLSISRYIAELVKQQIGTDWPEGFFDEVVGGWQGEPLKRAPQGQLEEREPLQP